MARAARRDRAADRRRHLGRRLRTVSQPPRPPTSPRASSSPASRRRCRRSRTACSAPARESKWCSLDAGSWSALRALTITIEDDERAGAPGSAASCSAAAGAAAPRRSAVCGADVGAGIRFGETMLDGARVGADRVPLREGDDRRRVAGDAGCSPATRRRAPRRRSPPPSFSDGPHALVHCVTDFAGNVGCTPPHTVLIDNNAPAHPRAPALAGGDGWRRVERLRPRLGEPRPGRRRARSPAPPGGSPARPASTPASSSPPAATCAALHDLAVPAAGAYTLAALAARRSRQRGAGVGGRRCRCASTTSPRASPSRPTPRRGLPEQLRADVTDAHSGPAAGTISYRRARRRAWIELPTKLVRGDAPGKAQLVAPLPDLGARHLRLPRRRGRRRRQHRLDHAARRRHRDGAAQAAAAERTERRRRRAKTRLFARLRWRPTAAATR